MGLPRVSANGVVESSLTDYRNSVRISKRSREQMAASGEVTSTKATLPPQRQTVPASCGDSSSSYRCVVLPRRRLATVSLIFLVSAHIFLSILSFFGTESPLVTIRTFPHDPTIFINDQLPIPMSALAASSSIPRPAKRARLSPSTSFIDEDSEPNDEGNPHDINEAVRAKAERKHARVGPSLPLSSSCF